MKVPPRCVVDTNIPLTANLHLRRPPAEPPEVVESEVPVECVLACIEAIEEVIKSRGLVIDAADEIFDEYRHHLSLKGEPGVGDKFLKWVHDHRWSLPASQRVEITPEGDSYLEFPVSDALKNFDRTDRKFVAVANAGEIKWPILEATDSKWWGWRQALAAVGITVCFLCPDYAETKYGEKIHE